MRALSILSTLALFAILTAGCGESGGDMAVLNLEPRAGTMAGEQPVKIIGKNFRTDIGYTVYFGTQRATSVTILSDSEILVTTPMVDEPETVDVFLTADNGPAFKLAQAFSFQQGSEEAGSGTDSRGNLAY
jgi:hypothetical protein